MMKTQALIEFRELSKSYMDAEQGHSVFQNVNGVINDGEFVVLVGKSGSGKSTLLNLISGIDTPTSGEILFNDIPLTQLSEQKRTLFRRRNIGFIFQTFNLIQTLTVTENLLLPLELNKLMDDSPHEKILGLLEQLGIADRAEYYPDRLSGGEQQRVAIARALIHDPFLVLADEPTGNLDLETGQEVLDLLDKLVRTAGKTMVMVTHSREVIGLADRVMTIRDCQLIESDPSI
jgi:putative ABC transport system ATP-binding protein